MPSLSSDVSSGLGQSRALLVFVVVAATYLTLVWIGRYDGTGNYDDKAVHYYSAARLYADSRRAETLEEARLGWISKLEPSLRSRTDNRLRSYAAYPLPATLLRSIVATSRSPEDGVPDSVSRPFRNTMLVLHLLALASVIAVSLGDRLVLSTAMLVLVLASIRRLGLDGLAPAADYDWHFLSYVPRCSAVLLLGAAFVAFVRRRRWWGSLLLALIPLWHLGAGLVWLPVAAASMITVEALARGGVALRVCAVIGLVLALAATPLTEGWGLLQLWVPILVLTATGTRPALFAPGWREPLIAASSFLFVSKAGAALLGAPAAADALYRWTGNPLVGEIGARMEGPRHVAAVVVAVLLLLAAADAWARRRCLSRPRRVWALLALQAITLLIAIHDRRDPLLDAVTGRASFYRESDAVIERVEVGAAELSHLDPRDEASFFASLGDFLLRRLEGRSDGHASTSHVECRGNNR